MSERYAPKANWQNAHIIPNEFANPNVTGFSCRARGSRLRLAPSRPKTPEGAP